ncbi:hypothetical protein GN330_07225 [Nitratireductor sp. CAU 1489]|uniref:DUF5343 domain-containing protein n=1 Tax=Nitratireductor arenosus TaxID=2682096 RepID=A0A844QG45_9HYPH|nr:DUF5343 domain-containing protein [Nitratireductor arenosus]MVA97038.1 hypothetical protein [Nitratireductor arenosus]
MGKDKKSVAQISQSEVANATTISAEEMSKSPPRRDIKGGIPYTASPGVLKKALELMVQAERPDKFSANYMETVLKLTGGAARAVPPFLKKMQFIGSDGAPTNLYSKFKTDGGRSQAAYEGLKNAFSELFRRNEYIYKAEEGVVKDVIVEITGLKKNDKIVRLMYSSFDAVRSFISSFISTSMPADEKVDEVTSAKISLADSEVPSGLESLGLSYQINIILPETENISVFNAIFRSLRENLLR